MCVTATGCCIEAPGMCVDDLEEGQCSGDWVFDTACDTIDECQPVTGCCANGNGATTCMDDVEDINCNISFVANAECSCLDPVGCCSGIDAATTCENNFTDTQCTGAQGFFSAGLQCNSEDTCGQLGCCQGDEQMCSLTNMGDCSGTWVPDDTCTESGICATLITGCCQDSLAPPGCSVTFADECPAQDFFVSDACLSNGLCESVDPPPTVPTIGQWGMIAMAGLLGIFSLFIIMRRHRYNVS